jgi:hypothetical protein
MIPEIAWRLLPETEPTESPPWAIRVADASPFSKRERLAYLWAIKLLSQASGQGISTAVIGLAQPGSSQAEVVDISAGFVSFGSKTGQQLDAFRTFRMREKSAEERTIIDGDSELNYTFGVVIGINDPKLFSREPDLRQLVSLPGGFPVIVEPRALVTQGPPYPSGVSAACYATPSVSKRFYGPRWSSGIVIARHVLANYGFSTGVSIPMSNGKNYSVSDIDPAATTIDAAILDCGALPTGTKALPLATAVAPSSLVSLALHGGAVAAQVLRINDHPNYFGNMMAHRAFVDKIGTSGDSGSLVTGPSLSTDAVGIYIGRCGLSPDEGLVQSLRQVVKYFEIDLHI